MDFIFSRKWLFLILVFGVILVSGCTSLLNRGKDDISGDGIVIPIEGKEGTKHYVIIGFGIVTVKKTEGETAAIATNSQALGINLSDQPGLKLGVGYSSSTVLTVPDGALADDVRLEVSKRPFGLLKVTTHSAKLKDSQLRKGEDNAEK
jgi:hypothetical protein